MSRWGKRKDKENFASDGDSDGGGAPAKKNPRKGSDDSDEIVACDLSKNRRVKVRNWQGKIVVDIREFYSKDGKEMPGKKGQHNGGYRGADGEEKPQGKRRLFDVKMQSDHQLAELVGGISLSMDQWKVLRDHVDEIDNAVAENT